MTALHEPLDLATQAWDARIPLLPSFVSSLLRGTTIRTRIPELASANGYGLCSTVTPEKGSEKMEILIYSGGFVYSCKQAIMNYL